MRQTLRPYAANAASFTSTGVNAPEDFNASMISGVKIIFTPSAEIKKQIQDVKFTKSN